MASAIGPRPQALKITTTDKLAGPEVVRGCTVYYVYV